MNNRHRLIQKSVVEILKHEESKLRRIELYETCFAGGDLERQGLLHGVPSENEFDNCWKTIKTEFDSLFSAIDLDKVESETKNDLRSVHCWIEDWPVGDIMEVIQRI